MTTKILILVVEMEEGEMIEVIEGKTSQLYIFQYVTKQF